MFEESRTEFMIRWHVYRRWRRPPNPGRKAEFKFYKLMDSIPKGGLFLDLGANVGNITFQALKYGHHVVAVEPDPTALVSLRRRFGSNPRVEIVPKAVGSSSRRSVLFRRPDVGEGTATESSSLNETAEHRGGAGVEVEVMDIVQFFQGLPERPAIIEMDIEGSEAECLEALLDAGLHRSVGAMLVETHERFSSDIRTRLDRIRARLAKDGITNIDMDWL